MTLLVVEVTYLADRYNGDDWPPAPLKLMQAIVAGVARGRGPTSEDPDFPSAMRWIESQPPPVIWAPHTGAGPFLRLAVPNNEDDLTLAAWARGRPEPPNARAKRYAIKPTAQHLLEGSRTVRYLWQIAPGEEGMAVRLAAYAGKVTILGRGVDLVLARGRVSEQAPPAEGMVHLPGPPGNGAIDLQSPAPGSYASIEEIHRARTAMFAEGGLRLYRPPLVHQLTGYRVQGRAQGMPWVGFRLLTPDGRESYRRDARFAVELSAMVRHAAHGALRRQDFPAESIAQWLGHGDRKGPRLGVLPLPSVGHEHADGMLRRVLLSHPDRTLLRQISWSLDGAVLLKDGHPAARLAALGHDAVIGLYTKEASTWWTATPVVLPGYDAGGRRAARLIDRALVQSGMPPPASVEISTAPWHRHGHRAGHYSRPRYLPYPQQHVHVRWEHPVPGPLALGAGRYVGLGVMTAG